MESSDGADSYLSRNNNDVIDRRVCLIYDERMCKHFAPDDVSHPECPGRIRAIWERLNFSGLAKRCVVLKAKDADDKHLGLVHTKGHIELIKNIASSKSEYMKKTAAEFSSIYFNEGSSEAAYLAAGSVIEVAEKVAKGELDSAFAIVRPPGHHAEENKPMGFCLHNNVAIATSYLLNERSELGIKKILIVDWDVHHGNGTQKMFYNDPRVLYFSVHRFDSGNFYPPGDEGSYIMIGKGRGRGYNINVPLEGDRYGDADYVAVWDKILVHVAKEFNPDLIMISAGFDAAEGDPLGGCCVSPYGFSILLEKLLEFAGGKIVMALEGGYNPSSIAKSSEACVEVLLQGKAIAGSIDTYPFKSTWRVIVEVHGKLRPYWPSLYGKLLYDVTNMTSPIEKSSSDSDSDHENSSPSKEALITVDGVIQSLMNLKVDEDSQDETILSLMLESEFNDILKQEHGGKHVGTSLLFTSNDVMSIRDRRHKFVRALKMLVEETRSLQVEYAHHQRFTKSLNGSDTTSEKYKQQPVVGRSLTQKVAKGELDSTFAIVRPPGNHPEKNKPIELGIKKILIVDWDVHHGNGTKKMFYNDPRVLYFSVHRFDSWDFYPPGDEGSYIMIGKRRGRGYNINFSWEGDRYGDADYVAVWDNILVHVAREFNPDLIMISAGFDAAEGGPLGGCSVSPYGFSILLEKLLEFVGGKIVMALEGGYNLSSIANSVEECVDVLLQGKAISGSIDTYPFRSTWPVIIEVHRELSPYWPSLYGKLLYDVTNMTSPIEKSSSDSESDHENSSPSKEAQIIVDGVVQSLMNLKVDDEDN